MKIIEASYVIHRGSRRIKLVFDADEELNLRLKKITGSRFSKTMWCWHIPCNKKAYLHFKNNLPRGWKIKEGPGNTGEPKVFIERFEEPGPPLFQEKVIPFPTKKNQFSFHKREMITRHNKEALDLFIQQLDLKAYSKSTIRTYRQEFSSFLEMLNQRKVETITPQELKRYMHYCVMILQLSENTLHSRLNALKFYFEQVLKKDKFFFEIPRPKKSFQLPRILGEQEIGRLFTALENKKHKAILFTAYSAGIRVSEVVSLQLKDIDSDRMQIFVRNAKGKKDRYVMLSPVLLDILRNYMGSWAPRPHRYLFEGMAPGEPMSSRSAQHIFYEAKEKAGIKKDLSFHSLRHSFATHLLEKGVDIKYIKDLLGHFSITTTTRYLHVKKENLVNIMSPLDDIFIKGKIQF